MEANTSKRVGVPALPGEAVTALRRGGGDEMEDDDTWVSPPPKQRIEGVWMPKAQYDALIAELARLRGLSNLAPARNEQSVRAAQNGCSALEHGVVCGARTYADHAYCPKHQQRFIRTGSPLLARTRGRKKKGHTP